MSEEELEKKTHRVIFRVALSPGQKVSVAGTFNGWDPESLPLRDRLHDGVYTRALNLPAGRYEYKLVVDGQWRIDPECRNWTGNEHGTLNNVLVVR